MSTFRLALVYGHQNQSDTQTGEELLSHIQLTAEHIEALLSGILSFACVNTRQAMPAEDLSMEATLQWAVLNLKTAIEQSEASVTHDTLPNVRGDQAQIVDLLQNLISNAIKYRSNEPPWVHVAARQMDGEPVFAVTDNGHLAHTDSPACGQSILVSFSFPYPPGDSKPIAQLFQNGFLQVAVSKTLRPSPIP